MERLRTLSLAAILVGAFAAPAVAAPSAGTRLVECRAGDCLLVTGHRNNAGSVVSINGRAVPVSGQRKWRAIVPVDTVREWSAPYARTITIAVDGAVESARLPIGLLGHAEDLAFLVVRAK